MPLDPARIAATRPWFVRSAEDLRAAEHGFFAQPPLLGAIVFHCQPAAEKTIKGFLTWHDVVFRKTHDLGELGVQCTALDGSLESLCRRAEALTVYAWTFRYPGDVEQPSQQEAEEAFDLARQVHDAVLATLPSAVRP